MGATGIRGTFFDFIDDPWKHLGREQDAARFHADGLLVVEDGIITDFGAYDAVAPRHAGLEITAIEGRIILPGFIDGHIHFPQTRVLGAYGEQLLPWLQKWIFPEELKYKDRNYARDGAKRFFDLLLASGTTTCQAFTSSSPVSTEEFFEEATRRNMRVIAGLTGIDRNAPDDFIDTPDNFYRDSKALIARYHNSGRNLYAVTPRFAYGASPELLQRCEQLKQEHPDCWVNTHISENPAECRGVLEQHPGAEDYLGVYEKYGLVGPKFSGGHGVWLSDGEFRRMSASGAAVVFCPCSNLFLGSGLFRIGRATDPAHRVRMSFGTDMGGGNRFSMLNVLDDAYKVGMCNNTLLDGSVDPSRQDAAEAERNKMSPYRGFWSITLGGAEGLYLDDRLGNFNPGKEADFVALDWNAGPMAQPWHQSLVVGDGGPKTVEEAADLLFAVMMVSDERAVDETWIMGKRLYKKS
ncbi:guanine deaminase [Pseudoxanthobacter soli DSM 19599]|uniref:Guanine deaminase n=1 Tax=Pseudoxanthobacter soli DSM 19599 TaxID=1123029 RepID=A0A1M7ZEY3_9HYPH|nr:guanine deaminase [Pseudoxanthobacter soli]SHO63433.1 guanine deaminase [Pseudoxanthobacter soli DSM 19599]